MNDKKSTIVDTENPLWSSVETIVKRVMRPFNLFHSFVSTIILIILLTSIATLGYFNYRNMELSKTTASQIELINKYYVLQNQASILLKVIDKNLKESNNATPGSAPMELKVQTAKMMYDIAQLKQVPLSIVCGIAETESNWNTHAISSAGCVGLMQITPLYARSYLREKGINYKPDIWFDPAINVMCGISMLNDAQTEYVEKGKTDINDWRIALHSYFWGAANTQILFSTKDQRNNVPNMAYPMKVIEASKKYKEMGL
jgi:hypothetical protein